MPLGSKTVCFRMGRLNGKVSVRSIADDCALGHPYSRKEMQQEERPRQSNAELMLFLCHHETVGRSLSLRTKIVLSVKYFYPSFTFWGCEVKAHGVILLGES